MQHKDVNTYGLDCSTPMFSRCHSWTLYRRNKAS